MPQGGWDVRLRIFLWTVPKPLRRLLHFIRPKTAA